jgi:hypothetical protein
MPMNYGARFGTQLGVGAAQGGMQGGWTGALHGGGEAALGMIPYVGPFLAGAVGGYRGGMGGGGQTGMDPGGEAFARSAGIRPAEVQYPSKLSKIRKIGRGIGTAAVGYFAGPLAGAAVGAGTAARERQAQSQYAGRVTSAGRANLAANSTAGRLRNIGVQRAMAPQRTMAPPGGAPTPMARPGMGPAGSARMAGAVPGMPGQVATGYGAAGQQIPTTTSSTRSGGTGPGNAPLPHGSLRGQTRRMLLRQIQEGYDPAIESGLYQAATQGAQSARQNLQDTFARTGDTSGYNYGIPAGMDMSLATELAQIHPNFIKARQDYMNNLLLAIRGTRKGSVPPNSIGGGTDWGQILGGVGGLANAAVNMYGTYKASHPSQTPTATPSYFDDRNPGIR